MNVMSSRYSIHLEEFSRKTIKLEILPLKAHLKTISAWIIYAREYYKPAFTCFKWSTKNSRRNVKSETSSRNLLRLITN